MLPVARLQALYLCLAFVAIMSPLLLEDTAVGGCSFPPSSGLAGRAASERWADWAVVMLADRLPTFVCTYTLAGVSPHSSFEVSGFTDLHGAVPIDTHGRFAPLHCLHPSTVMVLCCCQAEMEERESGLFWLRKSK